MRFRTYEEATSFIKALLKAKQEGKRELLTAKLDSVPQWQEPKTPEPKLDGSRIVAIYMAYKEPTDRQKKQAEGAKMAGVALEKIDGVLVDVRQCKDGTTQVLFTNGLRNADGSIPWRGPNVDKGILCYLAVDEGLGEPEEDIIARVPEELKAKLKEMKKGKLKAQVPVFNPDTVARPVPIQEAFPVAAGMKVPRGSPVIDVPSEEPEPKRVKLK